jgi:hypothetical protein
MLVLNCIPQRHRVEIYLHDHRLVGEVGACQHQEGEAVATVGGIAWYLLYHNLASSLS